MLLLEGEYFKASAAVLTSTCRWIFWISLEPVTASKCELSELNCPCLAAAAHLSACLALNCHKMQFCTRLLRQYSNSGLASSAFRRKDDDSSAGGQNLMKNPKDRWALLYSCGIMWPGCHKSSRGQCCQWPWGQCTERAPSAAISEITVGKMLWIPQK